MAKKKKVADKKVIRKKDGTIRKDQYRGLKPFVKGDPRINRKGAPKKIVKLQNLLEAVFGIEIDTPEEIKKSSVGKILKAMEKGALKGNMHAANSLLDRLYGRPKQSVEVSGALEAREEVSKLMPFAKPKKD